VTIRRDERGGIFAISALMIPVFLLMLALVLDAGVWFTHKRSLQNRADAGALAAGVEYLSQLANCANPATAGTAATEITNVAKQYGGATGPFNQTPSTSDRTLVVVNAKTDQPLADNTDGDPCQTHDGDSISPNGGVWTDVIAQESNLRTLAGTFGVNLDSITARARVEVQQIVGVQARGGDLPFVNETGDQVDCAWAEFVDAGTGDDIDLLPNGTGPVTNPVLLTPDPNVPRRFSAPVGGIDLKSADDIAVQYWMGTKMSGGCDYDPTESDALAARVPDVPIDYINVWQEVEPKKASDPPMLHYFGLTGGTCGGPGFLYTSSLDPNATCTVNFKAIVVKGPGTYPNSITVSSSNPEVNSVTVNSDGSGEYRGHLTFHPNAVDADSHLSQSYTEVGAHDLSVSWKRGATSGEFESGACGRGCDETVFQRTYVADVLNSNPVMSAELTNGSGLPIENSYSYDPASSNEVKPFTIELTNFGIDQEHTFLLRDAVQNTGNRSHAIDCGQGKPDTPDLADAIVNGCKDPTGVNVRDDDCSHPPWPSGYRDCVATVPGEKSALATAYPNRFSCSDPNNWIPGASPANLSDSDPRFAYIFLTSWGRIVNAKHQGADLPIRAILRVYVTGWDNKQGNSQPGKKDEWEHCSGDNEPPPEPYLGQGEVLWGHFVDVVTLDDDVITNGDPCDMSPSAIACKPALVR
jgi:hypothetical protein